MTSYQLSELLLMLPEKEVKTWDSAREEWLPVVSVDIDGLTQTFLKLHTQGTAPAKSPQSPGK